MPNLKTLVLTGKTKTSNPVNIPAMSVLQRGAITSSIFCLFSSQLILQPECGAAFPTTVHANDPTSMKKGEKVRVSENEVTTC